MLLSMGVPQFQNIWKIINTDKQVLRVVFGSTDFSEGLNDIHYTWCVNSYNPMSQINNILNDG